MFLSGVTGSIRVDGEPAGKKTTTAPIIADGRSSKCNNCRILPANRKLYYIQRFLTGHPYPVPTTQLECCYISSVRIYLFFFSFGVTLICAYTIIAVSVYFNTTSWYRPGYHEDILRLVVTWPDESAFSCYCCLLIIYSSQMPTSFSYVFISMELCFQGSHCDAFNIIGIYFKLKFVNNFFLL